jgi:hypothetical protein
MHCSKFNEDKSGPHFGFANDKKKLCAIKRFLSIHDGSSFIVEIFEISFLFKTDFFIIIKLY